jgi:hypothetical protein
MKTQVEFRSSKFPPYEGEQEQINPGLWGKRFPEYLVQKLSEKGIETEEIIAEDCAPSRQALTIYITTDDRPQTIMMVALASVPACEGFRYLGVMPRVAWPEPVAELALQVIR